MKEKHESRSKKLENDCSMSLREKYQLTLFKRRIPDILYYTAIISFGGLAILNVIGNFTITGRWMLRAYLDVYGEQYIEMAILFYVFVFSIIKLNNVTKITNKKYERV